MTCKNYTGVMCITGHCPSKDKNFKCEDCFYNEGCADCYFSPPDCFIRHMKHIECCIDCDNLETCSYRLIKITRL